MNNQIPITENYLYDLLKKKYHTSEVVRSLIAEIKEKTKDRVALEPLRQFTIRFRGQVIDSSFEKTLRIVPKRLFNKGKIDSLHAFKEEGFVEAHATATLTEVESLVHYLMKPRIVLHYRKEIVKGASNLLIIDESEQNQLEHFTPDYIHRNYVTNAEVYEKYTGRLGDYLIYNGQPLTSEKIGRELRFNKIETANKIFTTAGLKEIYLNLLFLDLLLKLDLEQHYFKLRSFNAQEKDLKLVEEKINDLGFFAEIFNHIASTDNPLLSHEELFLDLMRLEHIIENNNWKGTPAYAGYVYSAAKKLNAQFKLLEEYNLFLTYAQCIDKFLAKLAKKVCKHKADIRSEYNNLKANYSELKKLTIILNHPLLQNDYQELLNSFNKLLAYLDFLTIEDKQGMGGENIQNNSPVKEKSAGKFLAFVKKCVESVFSVKVDISAKPAFRHDQLLRTDREEDVQKLILKFHENLENLSKLKTTAGEDALLEARKFVPQLTNLSDILDQFKELIKDVEQKKDMQEPFKAIFDKTNKFEILFKDIMDLGILQNHEGREFVRNTLTDLQKLFFNKPLKESMYQEIINKVQTLEDFILGKGKESPEKGNVPQSPLLKLYQGPIFMTIIDIKMGIQNILEKEFQIQKIDTFKSEANFFSYSGSELDGLMAQIIKLHEKLKDTCYYKNISEFETIEKRLDQLIEEGKGIDNILSLQTRGNDTKVSKEPDIHIDYLKNSQLTRRNLEKAILLLQNQIIQMNGFMHAIKNALHQHSLVSSGVATSVLFDQITYLLSNIDVRLLDMTKLTENMFNESVDTIFHYQAGEVFIEPEKADMEHLLKEIEKKTVVRVYQNKESVPSHVCCS